jgi:hypothetical protein
MFFGKKDGMCAVRKAQLRWQDATFSVPHALVRCSRPQPDGCKEEYCEGKQKREAEQSERRKEEPEKKNRVRVTLHYGDEIQSIVEAIADTMFAFRGSSECLRPVGSGGLYFYPQAVTTFLPPSVSHPFL